MKYLQVCPLFLMLLALACASPASLPHPRNQFLEFEKTMVPRYAELHKLIDARMPATRDPQLKMRRRDIDGLATVIRAELVPTISQRIKGGADIAELPTEFDRLSELVVEYEIQINRYVMRAVTVGELRLDYGLHNELETFAAWSSSYRHSFGTDYRERYRNRK